MRNRLCPVRRSAESNFVIEYLCEYESILKPASICETVDPRFVEKNQGGKSRDTVSQCLNTSKCSAKCKSSAICEMVETLL
jgi:hypothetical protein